MANRTSKATGHNGKHPKNSAGTAVSEFAAKPAASSSKPPSEVRILMNTLGTSGLRESQGFVTEAYNAQLTWPTVYPLYNKMRRSMPEIVMIRQAFTAWSRNIKIEVDLPDEPTEDDKKYKTFIEEVFNDVDGGVTGLLDTMVNHVPFMGWGWWELLPGFRKEGWKAPQSDDWTSQYDDGLIGIRRFAWRDTSTFYGWEFDEKKNLTGLKQLDYPNQPVTLPLNKSLHLTFGDPNNPEGLSPLEAVWRLERMRYGFEVVMGIGAEHAAGYLDVKKTAGGELSSGDKSAIKEAARNILTAQEGNFALWPPGFEGEVKDIGFQAAGNLLSVIQHYSIMVLSVYTMQWMALNTLTSTGALASMQDSSQLGVFTFNSMMDGFAAQLDAQVGKKLYEWNKDAFPGLTSRPILRFTHVDKAVALDEMSQFFAQMNGILPLGDEDFKAIRKRAGFLPLSLPETPAPGQPGAPAEPGAIDPTTGQPIQPNGGGPQNGGGNNGNSAQGNAQQGNGSKPAGTKQQQPTQQNAGQSRPQFSMEDEAIARLSDVRELIRSGLEAESRDNPFLDFGGAGSGNKGHKGILGHQGGSAPNDGEPLNAETIGDRPDFPLPVRPIQTVKEAVGEIKLFIKDNYGRGNVLESYPYNGSEVYGAYVGLNPEMDLPEVVSSLDAYLRPRGWAVRDSTAHDITNKHEDLHTLFAVPIRRLKGGGASLQAPVNLSGMGAIYQELNEMHFLAMRHDESGVPVGDPYDLGTDYLKAHQRYQKLLDEFGGQGSGNYGHEGIPGHLGGSAPNDGGEQKPKLSPTVPIGTVQSRGDEDIDRLMVILHDTSKSREERQKAAHYAEVIEQIRAKRFAGGVPMRKFWDEKLAQGAAKIIKSGPRMYLKNESTGEQWDIRTKPERDYVDWILNVRKTYGFSMVDEFGGQGSGNYGHAGILGHQGGSAQGEADTPQRETFRYSLGILRKDMPQIHKDDLPEFLQWMREQGVKVTEESVTVQSLRPAQVEWNPEQAALIPAERLSTGGFKPLTVSKDNYVLDGTHRWARVMQDDPRRMVPIHRVDLPAREALALMMKFPKTVTKSIKEVVHAEYGFEDIDEFSTWLEIADELGGAGSGNVGHAGVAGHRGGSAPGTNVGNVPTKDEDKSQSQVEGEAKPTPAHSRTSPDVASEMAARAKGLEPELTKTLKGIVAENGGKMEGLEFRLKDERSLARKIEIESRWRGISPDEAAQFINDANRYTAVFEPETLVEGANNTVDALEKAGWKRYDHAMKNYFGKADKFAYEGYNTVWQDAKGNRMELQFHTPDSRRIKEANHILYEKFRLLDPSSPDAKPLLEKMANNWKKGYTPPTGYQKLASDIG